MAKGYQKPGNTSALSRERTVDTDTAVVALVREKAEFAWTASGDYKALSVYENRHY